MRSCLRKRHESDSVRGMMFDRGDDCNGLLPHFIMIIRNYMKKDIEVILKRWGEKSGYADSCIG